MVNEVLSQKGIDALIVTDPINMRYISGFVGEGMLYISSARSVIITDSRYTEAAKAQSYFDVIMENTGHRRIAILSELVMQDNAKTLGFEDMAIIYSEYEKYSSGLESIKKWIPLGNALNDLRLVKTDEEIDFMTKASEIADKAFEGLLSVIKPGMTELEGVAELEYRMKRLGAADVSFPTIFAAGRHSSMPHAIPDDYKVQNGDFITIDFGCKYNGYCSDTTRTVVVGEASPEQKRIYDIVLKAHMNAFECIKPGATGECVDAAARDIINDAGYGQYFGHATGHGVGLYIHEEPRFAPNVKTVYKAGMTGTVEPGIYLPGKFGVRIEDMIVVTDSGCRSFTHLAKELICL